MKVQTTTKTCHNPDMFAVSASYNGVTKVFIIHKDEAMTKYPNLSQSDAVAKLARKRFRGEEYGFTGYD